MKIIRMTFQLFNVTFQIVLECRKYYGTLPSRPVSRCKVEMYPDFTVVTFSALLIKFVTASNVTVFSHIARVGEPLIIPGCTSTKSSAKWKHEDNIISFRHEVINDDFKNNSFVYSNYSLFLEHVCLFHEGFYECGYDSLVKTRHILIVEVPPKLFLSYENSIVANASYDKDQGYERFSGNPTYVLESKAINVTCLAEGAKPEGNITWMKNGEVVIDNVTPQVPTSNLQENRTFDSLSTLQFTPIGENINVTCNVRLDGTDINASTSATFLTHVEPKVFFLLNGSRVYGEEVYVITKETINITCCAKGSRPASILTWEENYDNIKSSLEERHNAKDATFDTFLSLVMLPESDVQRVTCKSSTVAINETKSIDLKINTYVLHEPSITLNDVSFKIIKVKPNDNVTLICNAADSRPKTNLTWKINGFSPQETTSKVSQSFDSSNLIFQPKDNDLVQCYSYLDGPNITRVANVTFDVNDDSIFSGYIIKVIVACVVVTLTIFLVVCVCIATRRFKGSQSSNLPTTLGIPMEETSTTTQPKNPQKEYEEDANKTYPKPPDLELPRIPGGSETPYYSELPEQENAYELSFHTEYYSAMSESGASGKMVSEKDICFILNIKMGHIYDRWTGTIDVNLTEKCVILSTVSDSLRKKEIHWHKFVKRVLELPVVNHLTSVEGIGIYEGKFYLIHEHMACETLDVGISVPCSRTEVMGHLTGILEGLEVVQSFGFLHPGFSTKKVLLTKKGICKLYDFCLSEDASNTVRIKKSRITCTLNQLSPEALLRDKYTKESDVWSVAVVIWEILSCGSSPFPNEEQSPESEKAAYSLPETWPTNYKLLRNKRLFECWNQDTFLRPTTLQLKSSFIESFESLDTYGPSNTFTDDVASSYVHMKGIEKLEDNN